MSPDSQPRALEQPLLPSWQVCPRPRASAPKALQKEDALPPDAGAGIDPQQPATAETAHHALPAGLPSRTLRQVPGCCPVEGSNSRTRPADMTSAVRASANNHCRLLSRKAGAASSLWFLPPTQLRVAGFGALRDKPAAETTCEPT